MLCNTVLAAHHHHRLLHMAAAWYRLGTGFGTGCGFGGTVFGLSCGSITDLIIIAALFQLSVTGAHALALARHMNAGNLNFLRRGKKMYGACNRLLLPMAALQCL